MSSTTWRVSFSRALAVEARRRAEDRLDGRSRVAGLGGLECAAAGGRLGAARRLQPAAGDLLQQPLQHAARVLAAGNAQVELGLGAAGDGRRVGLAQVAALAAVLLRHGGEQAGAAAACPRRAACARRSAWRRRARARRHRRPASALAAALGQRARRAASRTGLASSDSRPAKKPLSQARCSIENGAVSGIMEHGRRTRAAGERNGGLDGHAAASRPRRRPWLLSAAISWRRVNARNVSSRRARCAR